MPTWYAHAAALHFSLRAIGPILPSFHARVAFEASHFAKPECPRNGCVGPYSYSSAPLSPSLSQAHEYEHRSVSVVISLQRRRARGREWKAPFECSWATPQVDRLLRPRCSAPAVRLGPPSGPEAACRTQAPKNKGEGAMALNQRLASGSCSAVSADHSLTLSPSCALLVFLGSGAGQPRVGSRLGYQSRPIQVRTNDAERFRTPPN